jgi:adenylate cyclase
MTGGGDPDDLAALRHPRLDSHGSMRPADFHKFSIPAGTAVLTGVAFVGATGLGTTVDDFTALGDAVNITARLASAVVAGEVIVSVAAAEAAGMATGHLERRSVEIRGHTEPIEVIVLPAGRQKVSPDQHHV